MRLLFVLALIPILFAFPVDVIQPFPASISGGQHAQAIYEIKSNQSMQYFGYVNISNAPSGTEVWMNNIPCISNNTFICFDWLGTGVNTVRINITFPAAVPSSDWDITLWFELSPRVEPVKPNVTIPTPPVPKPNVTIPPAPKPNVTVPVVKPIEKPVPNVTLVPKPPTVVPMNSSNNSNSTDAVKTQSQHILPEIDEASAIALSFTILIVGLGVLVFICR